MIPAPLLDRFIAFVAWLAERIAEIRERNALRDQAALDQAGDVQAETDQASLDLTLAGALLADGPLSPPGSALSSAPQSPQSPLPSQSDRDSLPQSPPALSPATPALSTAAIAAPAAAAAPPPRHQARADASVAAPLAKADLPAADPRPGPILRPFGGMARGGSRALLPASRSAGQAADPVARVGGAEAVGWDANSALSRAGRRTPILFRYRTDKPPPGLGPVSGFIAEVGARPPARTGLKARGTAGTAPCE